MIEKISALVGATEKPDGQPVRPLLRQRSQKCHESEVVFPLGRNARVQGNKSRRLSSSGGLVAERTVVLTFNENPTSLREFLRW
jgi:hypothetical protein